MGPLLLVSAPCLGQYDMDLSCRRQQEIPSRLGLGAGARSFLDSWQHRSRRGRLWFRGGARAAHRTRPPTPSSSTPAQEHLGSLVEGFTGLLAEQLGLVWRP